MAAGGRDDARRRFHEAKPSSPDEAGHALRLIGKLYAIERNAKDLSPADRATLRRDEAARVRWCEPPERLQWYETWGQVNSGDPGTGITAQILVTLEGVFDTEPLDTSFTYADAVRVWTTEFGYLDSADFSVTIDSVVSTSNGDGTSDHEVVYTVEVDPLGWVTAPGEGLDAEFHGRSFPTGEPSYDVVVASVRIWED